MLKYLLILLAVLLALAIWYRAREKAAAVGFFDGGCKQRIVCLFDPSCSRLVYENGRT